MADELVKAEKIDYSELGAPGLKRFGGTVDEEFLTELKGANRYKIYEQMRKNDPVIAAMLRALGWILQSVKWSIEPDTQTSGEPADFVEACRDGMDHTWAEHVSEARTFLDFGFSLFEIVYQRRDDGAVGWKRFGFRSQDSIQEWEFDAKGYATAGLQCAPPDYKRVKLPLNRCLHYRLVTERGNPEGDSILRAAYRAWYFLNQVQEIEGIGLERDLAGIPVFYLGDGTSKSGTKSDLALLKDIVRNVRRDEQEGIIIPHPKQTADGRGVLFELVASSGKREFDTGAIIGRYEQRIAMSVLAQWLMLGMQSVGSYALSTDQSDFFRLGIQGMINTICEQFTKQAIVPLLAVNPQHAGNVRMVGRLPVSPEYSRFAAAVNQLVQAQVLDPSDARLRSAVADALGLPQPALEIADAGETGAGVTGEQHDLNANTLAAKADAGPDAWTTATDAYQAALGREYDRWAKRLSADLEDADPEDYDDIVAVALAALAAKLKRIGRSDLARAFQTGAKGNVSPEGWTRLAQVQGENEKSIDESLIPALRGVDWRQVAVGGAAAVLALLSGKQTLAENYAAVYWRALNTGAGEQAKALNDPPVRWVLHDTAAHCDLCPVYAREYANFDDMVAQCSGPPGSGQTPCRQHCRCFLEWWDGETWQPF